VIGAFRARLSWIVRILWITAALLPNALTASESTAQVSRVTLTIVGWTLWSLVAIATWIEHPISLTITRTISPVVAAWLVIGLPADDWQPAQIAGATCAIIVLMVMVTRDYGSRQVQAGAYGDEVRYLLRVPAPVVLPAALGWLLCVGALSVTLIGVDRDNLIVTGVALIVTVLAVFQVGPKLHRLSKRWLVKVPAGWVVHDDVILAENLLLRTHRITSMSPALASTEAFDLTGYTTGVPVEISLRDTIDVRLSELGARLAKTTDVVHARALLVAPTSEPTN
jgi:hypothetical protein